MSGKIKLLLYVVVFGFWGYARQWPFGDMLQTVTDVALLVALPMGYFNHMKKKYNSRPRIK